MKTIEILKGDYKGRKGQIVEEGTFNVFGREITGVKVDAGLAGLLVLVDGDYKEIEVKEKTKAFDRFN